MMNIVDKVQEIVDHIEELKSSLVEDIFTSVDKGEVSKLEAIGLLSDNNLLPVENCISDMPKFMRDVFEVDYEGCKARGAIFKYNDDLYEENFKDTESEEVDQYALYPEMTLEEGADLVYDYIKKHRIIGTLVDW